MAGLRSVEAASIILLMKLTLLIVAALSMGPFGPREDARVLLERVVENQERNQTLQRQFAYVETVATEHLRKDKSTSKRKEETFEVTPAPGGEYRRLIAKNGRSLTLKEEEKEEEKFQKYLKKQLELSPGELKEKEDNIKKRVGRFESRIREALEVFEFSALPDETLSGRPVRVFQFSPLAGYKPHSRATQLLSRTEGTIWIDSEKNQIAKLQMHFREDMKFLAGIFGRISKGTQAIAVMKHIGDEVWLFDTMEVYLKGRFYFLKKYNRRLSFSYSNYKKYTVNTEETVKNSNQ
jgi:hypothetical protein